MKIFALLISASVLLCGCARKEQIEGTRAELAEAQKKIEKLESERVTRAQYDVTRASLKTADERIEALERELKTAQQQLAAQQQTGLSGGSESVAQQRSNEPAPTAMHLAKGGYALSNETYVFSPDAQLNFGNHLQITSPTGLLVTDPDLRVVGGDLSIKAKGMQLEATDGLLTTEADGSVKFTGTTLTMKFDEKKPESEKSAGVSRSPSDNLSEGTPAATNSTPVTTNSPLGGS